MDSPLPHMSSVFQLSRGARRFSRVELCVPRGLDGAGPAGSRVGGEVRG